MLRRPFVVLLTLLLVALGISGALYAQMEPGDRGILPIESSGTLEITSIHVDVGGKDAQSARFAGWRIAQRQGFKALWAKTHGRPISEAPNLPDSTLDGMVSSIIVEREQLGPNRYIADLGILFDRARAGELLGIAGDGRRSAPMLLIPVMITGGTATSVEIKNPWQRAWAYFRTAESPIDYVRVSGLGIDPLLVNMAQTERPGRGWWRNVVDFYGTADILVAEAQVQRLYPGGPARARFIARHGPDGEIVGGFGLISRTGNIPELMNEGVRRMDELFGAALAAGRLRRDPTLDIPEPPPPPEEEEEEAVALYPVQIYSPDSQTWNFAVATLRATAGVRTVNATGIAIGGVSTATMAYRGDISAVLAFLRGRGWTADYVGGVLRVSNGPFPGAPTPSPAPSPPQPSGEPPGNTQ